MKLKNKEKFLYFIIITNIILLLLYGSFERATFDKDFYRVQHEKNNLYETFGKEKTENLTSEMFDFLKNKGSLDSDFFNEKEISHMDDVKSLFLKAKYIYFSLLVLLVISLYFFFDNRKNPLHALSKIFFYVAVSIFIIVFSFALLQSQFDSMFIGFHKVCFDNENWLLDPSEDKLIVMFPKTFFYEISKLILINFLFNGFLFLLLSGVIYALNKKIEFKK